MGLMSTAEHEGKISSLAISATPARGQAFPRSARLTKPYEFKAVFRNPLVSADRYFKVLARVNDGPLSRLGLAVSRKVDRKARGRNRIKRVSRESFRRLMNQPQQINLDIVILPRLDCDTISNPVLFESLANHWLRLQKKAAQFEAERRI